jgi:ActR/RegA family two-component response regulator
MPEILAPPAPSTASTASRAESALESEAPAGDATEHASERPTREQFMRVFEETGRNVRATSKHFGKDRRQIYRWLQLFGIER